MSESDFHGLSSSCHRQIYTTNAYTTPITILTQLLLLKDRTDTVSRNHHLHKKTSHLCFMSLRPSNQPASLRHLYWCKQVSCVCGASHSLFVRCFFHTLRRWRWTLDYVWHSWRSYRWMENRYLYEYSSCRGAFWVESTRELRLIPNQRTSAPQGGNEEGIYQKIIFLCCRI